MAACLSCEEIEQKICDLADQLSALTDCEAVRVTEDGKTFDLSPGIEAKKEVLRTYQALHKAKCEGSMDLYEFVHVPCVKPATCKSSACSVNKPASRNRRRYRG